MDSDRYIVILYTTRYREGGPKFERAALLLATQKAREFPDGQVLCQAVESKAAMVAQFEFVRGRAGLILEFHFLGHSGLYGIMFGTVAWPEQMSPYEWRQLSIPFAPQARAYFHACRTGRWFAPFFARTFQVAAYGHFYYTTVSRRPDRFAWEGWGSGADLYIISVPGKKSHGWLGSLQKYLLRPKAYPMLEFPPQPEAIDTSYDPVAPLYDQTFEDISVRADELGWLRASLESLPWGRVLDIGCGTGSFLRALEDLVAEAWGVDISQGMIDQARKRTPEGGKLHFDRIDGPQLPFPDSSFDVVMSVLSFRYLDWDPLIQEVLRVLKPGGRLLVIDMVAAPLKGREILRFLRDKIRHKQRLLGNPGYARALRQMVTDPRWKTMLRYNPMRAEHELKWYLQSRFPGGELSVLNYAYHSRILAFRSPPLYQKTAKAQCYP